MNSVRQALTGIVLLTGLAAAQDKPVVINLANTVGGTATRQTLADGTVEVRMEATQPARGDATGMFNERVTQRVPPAEEGTITQTTQFKLEAANGTIEGYYNGSFDKRNGPGKEYEHRGLALVATGAFSSFLFSEVVYKFNGDADPRIAVTVFPRPPLGNSLFGQVQAAAQAESFKEAFDNAPNPDGDLFYLTAMDVNNKPAIFTVEAEGGTPKPLLTGEPLMAPRGIAASPTSGAVYVTDTGGRGMIYQLRDGKPFALEAAAGYEPQGLEVMRSNGADVVYFAGRDPHDGVRGVFRLAVRDGAEPSIVYKGGPLVEPDSIAIASNGVIYVSDRAASGTGRGAVYRIRNGRIAMVASGFRPGSPAGIALTRNDSLLFVSALNAQGQARVVIVDTETLQSGVADKGIGENTKAGGLHRAAFGDTFGWMGIRPYLIRPE